MTDRNADIFRQGFMKPLKAAKVAKPVSDAQFRANILADVQRRNRIMFGEE